MKTKILALALASRSHRSRSQADVSYKYIDFSYQTGSVDPAADFDGFRFNLSYPINESWYVKFDYTDVSFDPTGSLSDYALSAGWHNDLLFVNFGYESADGGGGAESGYALDFGARSMVGENFELNGHIGYADLGNFDTFMRYGFGGVWMFGDNMGVSFNYDIWSADTGGDLDTMGVGFRYNF